METFSGHKIDRELVVLNIFESQYRRSKDAKEVLFLYNRYGVETLLVLGKRAHDHSLTSRDRKHWKRLKRKARAARNVYLNHVKA